jgi:hypothetical protein
MVGSRRPIVSPLGVRPLGVPAPRIVYSFAHRQEVADALARPGLIEDAGNDQVQA